MQEECFVIWNCKFVYGHSNMSSGNEDMQNYISRSLLLDLCIYHNLTFTLKGKFKIGYLTISIGDITYIDSSSN